MVLQTKYILMAKLNIFKKKKKKIFHDNNLQDTNVHIYIKHTTVVYGRSLLRKEKGSDF